MKSGHPFPVGVPRELWELVDSVCSGTITGEGRDRLEEFLRADEGHRLFYLSYLDVHAQLHWELRVANPQEGDSPNLLTDVAPQAGTVLGRSRRWLRYSVAVAVLIGVISAAVHFRGHETTRSTALSVATLTRQFAARWAKAGRSPRVGDALPLGVIDLAEGVAEIEFSGGAVMVMEAPARVELLGPLRVVLSFGQVVARVPEHAIGFVIETRQAEIVDLGTEFGVAVGPANDTLVQVFEGKVVAKPKGGTPSETAPEPLVAGQALRIADSRDQLQPHQVGFEAERFVRRFPTDVDGTPSGPLYNRSRFDAIHIVPAPPGIAIDGDLSDWDRSGAFCSACTVPYGKHYYVEGMMMYDAANIYIGAHVGDPAPMRSVQDPWTDPEHPWRGGSVIVRLSTSQSLGWPLKGLSSYFRSESDPEAGRRPQDVSDSIVHLVMWYYRPGKQPRLHLARGMDFHGSLIDPDGWKGAFRQDQDGLGYTLEYSIPWSLLRPEPGVPRGGEVAGACWTVHWSDRNGKLSRGHLVEITNPDEPVYNFQRAVTWGKAVYHATGNLAPGTVASRPAEGSG